MSFRYVTFLGLLLATATSAEILRVDATGSVQPPKHGYFKFGEPASPAGQKLEVNSRYIEINGQPAVPVAGKSIS